MDWIIWRQYNDPCRYYTRMIWGSFSGQLSLLENFVQRKTCEGLRPETRAH